MKTIVALSILLATTALAQEKIESPKPLKEHEYLKQFEGTWETRAKFAMEPGKPPMETKGSEVARITCAGLWLVFETRSEIGGQEFVGHGTLGYDVHKKKFVGSWIDSMGTGLYVSEGSCDEKGKVFTCVLEGPDPATGKPMKMKHVNEVKDKDSHTITFSVPGPDGSWIPIGTVDYRRKQ